MPGRGPRVRALLWAVIRSGACDAPKSCACAHKPRTAPRLQRLVEASAPGQVWAIDFQLDSDWKGRVFKVCNVIDEFTHQHLAFRIERRMGAADMIEMLDLAVLSHGAPQVLRADNGPEFIAGALRRWASEHDTLQAFIPPGQPWLGGFMESLHNRMRNELLEDNMFEDLNHARALIGAWSHRYNEEHPHSALGWLSPNQYAHQWAQHHQQQPSKHPAHKTRPGHMNLHHRKTSPLRNYDTPTPPIKPTP